MYLHIGSEIEISIKNIVFILDIKTIKSKYIKEFYEKNKNIKNISKYEPKTIILAEYNKSYKIFLSPISTFTLQKRLNDNLKYLNKNNYLDKNYFNIKESY